MTIKRLSLAAAISFSLFASGSAIVRAEGVDLQQTNTSEAVQVSAPQDSNILVEKAVGSDNIIDVSDQMMPQAAKPVVTGKAAPVKKPVKKPAPIAKPVVQTETTGEACPCPQVWPAAPVEPCAVAPACPVACPVAVCTDNAGPACSTCQGVPHKPSFCEKQVYAYPASIYGKPSGFAADPYNMTMGNYCPSCSSGLNNSRGLSTARNEYTSNPCGCGSCGSSSACANGACGITGGSASTCQSCSGAAPLTGAAAVIPPACNTCISGNSGCGSSVSRNFAEKACPITINSNSSIEAIKKSIVPYEIKTGAAAPLKHPFCDVPADFWAAQIIDRLAASQVIAGYPDQTFRPDSSVTRAEFSSLVVSGLNYQDERYYDKALFCDVPACHWAKRVIDKGMNGGLIAGYPDGLFKPNCPVTRAEALVIMSKALKDCSLDDCKADAILATYCDGKDVPAWAKIAMAKALQAGILKNTLTPDKINPNCNATRAEIAAMLSAVRVSMGIDPEPVACGCVQTGAAAYLEQQTVIKIPTLKVKLEDSVSAHENHVGDHFVARSQECVTINGQVFPENSKVYGQIVEVVRPTRNCEGSLKIAFTEIKGGGLKADLPREILCAEVQKDHKPNIISRIVKWPFTWTGALIGDVGRTVGGSIVILGNGSEEVLNNIGTAGGELFQGKFMAAGRSVKDSVVALVRTPIDITRTALSGAAGIFNITADEVAYVISADGTKVAQINPNEEIAVKFGCQSN
jgi:hypothetical protein